MHSKFKKYAKKDENTFINPYEFADKHTIGNRSVYAVVDEDKAIEINSRLSEEYGYEYGIDMVVFIEYKHFDKRPTQGAILLFDNRQYNILKVYANMGIYELHLSLSVGR